MSRTIKNRTWWVKTPHQPQRRPDEPVLFLKSVLIFSQELVKVMEEDA